MSGGTAPPSEHPAHSKPARLAGAALGAAQADKWDAATRYVVRISDECGGAGLNIALRAWIDTYIDHATDGENDSAKVGRVGFINGDDGKLEHDDAERIPDRIKWAGRLVQARGALDLEAFNALIDEMPDDGYEVGRYVSAVLEVCAQTINGLPRGFASRTARARWADGAS